MATSTPIKARARFRVIAVRETVAGSGMVAVVAEAGDGMRLRWTVRTLRPPTVGDTFLLEAVEGFPGAAGPVGGEGC